jgi:hypothetical protein
MCAILTIYLKRIREINTNGCRLSQLLHEDIQKQLGARSDNT